MTLEEYLSQLRELSDKATPGIWLSDWNAVVTVKPTRSFHIASVANNFGESSWADRDFIAASRDAVPRLIKIVEAQNRALKSISDSVPAITWRTYDARKALAEVEAILKEVT